MSVQIQTNMKIVRILFKKIMKTKNSYHLKIKMKDKFNHNSLNLWWTNWSMLTSRKWLKSLINIIGHNKIQETVPLNQFASIICLNKNKIIRIIIETNNIPRIP